MNVSEYLRDIQLFESMNSLPFDDLSDCSTSSGKAFYTMAGDVARASIHLSQHAGQPRYIGKQSIFSLARTSVRYCQKPLQRLVQNGTDKRR
jgi:hypothetical protein